VSYIRVNRKILMRPLSGLFATQRISPVPTALPHHPPDVLLAICTVFAPSGEGKATVTVLTPGAHNPATSSMRFLAQQRAVRLVEGQISSSLTTRSDIARARGPPLCARDLSPRRRTITLRPLAFTRILWGVPCLFAAVLSRRGGLRSPMRSSTGVADDNRSNHPPSAVHDPFYLSEAVLNMWPTICGKKRTWRFTSVAPSLRAGRERPMAARRLRHA